jgi:AcrR family transcriptional regulator
MLEHGYRRTTVAAVAREAGVSVDTVYELVGRKPVLLRELIEQALSGTDHAVAAEDREHIRAVRDEPDAARKIELYARSVRWTQERLAPLFLALRDASSTEPEAEAVWREVAERRAANMRRFAADLRATGRLRADLTIDGAADTVWAMNGSELYVLLTGDRGWSAERYEAWLADSWVRLLLDP